MQLWKFHDLIIDSSILNVCSISTIRLFTKFSDILFGLGHIPIQNQSVEAPSKKIDFRDLAQNFADNWYSL